MLSKGRKRWPCVLSLRQLVGVEKIFQYVAKKKKDILYIYIYILYIDLFFRSIFGSSKSFHIIIVFSQQLSTTVFYSKTIPNN